MTDSTVYERAKSFFEEHGLSILYAALLLIFSIGIIVFYVFLKVLSTTALEPATTFAIAAIVLSFMFMTLSGVLAFSLDQRLRRQITVVNRDLGTKIDAIGNQLVTRNNIAEAEINVQPDASIIERDRFLFEMLNQRQSQELERINDIDNKANNLIGFLLAITSFVTTISGLEAARISSQPVSQSAILIVGVVFLMSALAMGLIAQRVQGWELAPNATTLITKYWDKSLDEIIIAVGGAMESTVSKLEPRINAKAEWLQRSLYFSFFGLVLIFIYTAIQLLPAGK